MYVPPTVVAMHGACCGKGVGGGGGDEGKGFKVGYTTWLRVGGWEEVR